MVKTNSGERIFGIFNGLFLTLLMILMFYPFYYVLIASVSVPDALVQNRGLLYHPLGFTTAAYEKVFDNPMILISYGNTIFYVAVGTAVNIFLTSFGAYGLSRKSLYYRNHLMFMITFTMFFSGGLIPTYLLVKSLGITDTRLALILPNAISAWNLIIMRTYFLGVPESLEESAKIEGANDFTILFRIIIPVSMPIVSVMILFYGVAHWNSWFDAMIYLKKRSLFPLQLILREILIINNTEDMMAGGGDINKYNISEIIKYATIIVATLPILLLYPLLQKYFVKGVMIGAIKG